MSEPTPKEQRGPTNLRIKFRSATLEQFIERYAADVSRGGVFIRTREPLAVGTQLRLELQLQDGSPLLAGEGTVIWIRENDPLRANAAPGMAVRFDKLSPETEPTLDRILNEKARLEEAGSPPAQPGSGMAVRRPSAVFNALDASGRVASPASNAPTAPVQAGYPEAASERPSTPAVSKTSFLASRGPLPGSPSAPAAPGPFTRARNTTTRPVPVPSALFEPPTAADIDKALSVLEEAPGPAPTPPSSVPQFAPEDSFSAPTRVGPSPLEGGVSPADLSAAPEPDMGEVSEGAIVSAEATRPPGLPLPDGEAAPAIVPVDRAVVNAPAAPEVSRRFRAASRPYPTINRRRGTGAIIVLILVLGAAGAVVMKLRPGERVPPHAVSIPAQGIAPATAEPGTPPPPAAPQPATPPPGAATPPPSAAPVPPAAALPPARAPEKPAAAEAKPASSEHHHAARRHSREETAPRESSSKAAAATEKPAAEATTPEAKPAEAAPAEAKPAEAKPAEAKPAAENAAAAAPAAAADKPAAAKSVLKIASSPAGAEVLIDGNSVGVTPFSSKDVDPGSPHAITLKKDGFETQERMVGASDWSRAHGSSPAALKVSVKLHRLAAAPAESPKEPSPPPAEDTGGPYIKEVPSSP